MIDEAANEMRAVAIESIEKELTKIGNNDNRDAIIEAVRKVVLADVDMRVKEKSEELWQKGRTMLSTIQMKHKEKTQALSDDLSECLKKQQILESENEKLKQVLQGLASRFAVLGAVFNGAPKTPGMNGIPCGAGDTSTAASTMSPNQESAASELFSPATFTPGAADAGKATEPAKFADVPAFPFPAQTASPVPQLSLAEHLLQSPQPLSLASSLSPASSPKPAGEATGQDNNPNVFTFSFTLRKADGADLGLNVSHHEHDQVLRVEGVRSEGAVEAWNRQCASSAFAEKAVLAGDTITSVNDIMFDPKKMLEECRDRQLLKLTVVRQRAPRKPSTVLRADASEFVPGAAAAVPPTSPDDTKESAVDEAAADTVEDEATKPEE